jgi:hypothetical protein
MSEKNNSDTTTQTNLIEPFLIEMVFWYNRKTIEWKNTMTTLYTSDPIIQTVSDVVYTIFAFIRVAVETLYFQATHLRIEPSGNWLSLVGLIEHPSLADTNYRYNFVEKYEDMVSDDTDTTSDNASALLEAYYSRAVNTMISDKHIKEILLTIKDTDAHLVRTCIDIAIQHRPCAIPFQKSNVEFLCIEYTHPKLSSPITITIPATYFVVGNELLSMAFIQRFLEYQSLFVTYYFDEEYVVNVMDQDIQQYQLRRNNYIVLEEDTIRVVTIQLEHTNHFISANAKYSGRVEEGIRRNSVDGSSEEFTSDTSEEVSMDDLTEEEDNDFDLDENHNDNVDQNVSLGDEANSLRVNSGERSSKEFELSRSIEFPDGSSDTKIRNASDAVNSSELPSTEFLRTPSASRPEFFASSVTSRPECFTDCFTECFADTLSNCHQDVLKSVTNRGSNNQYAVLYDMDNERLDEQDNDIPVENSDTIANATTPPTNSAIEKEKDE